MSPGSQSFQNTRECQVPGLKRVRAGEDGFDDKEIYVFQLCAYASASIAIPARVDFHHAGFVHGRTSGMRIDAPRAGMLHAVHVF